MAKPLSESATSFEFWKVFCEVRLWLFYKRALAYWLVFGSMRSVVEMISWSHKVSSSSKLVALWWPMRTYQLMDTEQGPCEEILTSSYTGYRGSGTPGYSQLELLPFHGRATDLMRCNGPCCSQTGALLSGPFRHTSSLGRLADFLR